MKFDRILFVCLGNICRSPMAEAIFNQLLSKSNSGSLEVDSAGTSGEHAGELPDPRALETLHKNNIPFRHRARKITLQDLSYYDLIIAMDQSNFHYIQRMIPNDITNPPAIKMMRDFDEIKSGKDVNDPWYGDLSDFDSCFKTLNICCSNLIEYIHA